MVTIHYRGAAIRTWKNGGRWQAMFMRGKMRGVAYGSTRAKAIESLKAVIDRHTVTKGRPTVARRRAKRNPTSGVADWATKHPWMTFFLVSGAVSTVGSIAWAMFGSPKTVVVGAGGSPPKLGA